MVRECATPGVSSGSILEGVATCYLFPVNTRLTGNATIGVRPMNVDTDDNVDTPVPYVPTSDAMTVTHRQAVCQECGDLHQAEPSHLGFFGEGQVYAVVCGEFTSYYTEDGLL